MGLSVIDNVLAFQVEEQDYVKFTDVTGVVRSGVVLHVMDDGDTMQFVLSDDEEGDADVYTVDASKNVQLLGYESVAV
jgi:hypothetical protein